MEGIERWHGERPLLPLRFGDPDDVAALGAPARADLPCVRRWDPGPLYWAPALDLGSGAAALVPFDAVHTCWLAEPSAPETPFFASTNGLASGSHPVEAALHALCELIERDACALFDRLPAEARAARRVDLDGVDDPVVAALAGRLAGQDFALALWDASCGLGPPVFLAALVDARDRRAPAGFGSGCHPDRAIAALRAITEAAQTRAIAITGTRDDLGSELFEAGIGVRFRWALRDEGTSRRAWRRAPTRASDDLRDDLDAVLAAMARAGCGPVLAVDLSREPGISVLRLLVPGLEAGAPGDGVLPGARAARARELLA
jgi:ribosomal protein S12 methylthiotransferase accessory factor